MHYRIHLSHVLNIVSSNKFFEIERWWVYWKYYLTPWIL